ncbi:type IV pilin [Methanocorpusculum labreanum]|nr:type IV pilin [Methanocorpusculum labreanum]
MIRLCGMKDNGVSPVIAALLILALTILLIGIFAAGIFSLGNVDSAPIAGITISEKNGIITLTHFSGDTLPAGEYAILVNVVDQTREFQGDVVDFSPGTTLVWDRGTTEPLNLVSVIYTGSGGAVVIAEKQFYSINTSRINAAFTAEVTEGKNATSQVKVGVSGAKPLPDVIADLADVWVVLDQDSDQTTVEFTAEESSPDLEFSWTCGNGQTADTQAASFVYNTAGTYTVRLDIRNVTSGEVGTSSMILAVRDPGVTAMAWVKSNETYTTNVWPIAGRGYSDGVGGTGYTDRVWRLQFSNPTTHGFQMVFYFEKTGETPSTQVEYHVSSLERKWYHITGVYDQRGTSPQERSKLYIYGRNSGTIRGPINENLPLNTPTRSRYDVTRWKIENGNFTTEMQHEVDFPLTSEEITAIHTLESGGYTE